MTQESLEIPIDVDLSPTREAMGELGRTFETLPNVDLSPISTQMASVADQMKTATSTLQVELSAVSEGFSVPIGIDTSSLQNELGVSLAGLDPNIEIAPVVDMSGAMTGLDTIRTSLTELSGQSITATITPDGAQSGLDRIKQSFSAISEADGVVAKMEATVNAVDQVSSAASRAEFSAAGLSRTFTAVSMATKPLTALGGSLGVVTGSASLAASGAAYLAVGFSLVSTMATYLATGLGMVLAPLRGLMILPKLVAASFSMMFAVVLAPFKMLFASVKVATAAMWAFLKPIVKIAAAIFKLKVFIASIKIQFFLLSKFMGMLSPKMKALVVGLIALGAAGRAGQFGMKLIGKAMGAAAFAALAVKQPVTALGVAMLAAGRKAIGFARGVARGTKALVRFAFAKTIAGMKGLGGATLNVTKMIGGGLVSGISKAIKWGAGLAAIGVGWGIKLAADAEQAQVAFTTMLKSGDGAKAVLAELEQFAASTPFQLDSLRDGAKQLLTAGVPAQGLTNKLRQLGDIAAGTGKPIGDFVRIFAKVKSTGKVGLESLNQLAERGVPIYSTLQKQLGVSREEMLKMISAGKIGFPELNTAIESMSTGAGMFAGGMAAQSQTISGLFSTLKDNVGFAMRELGSEIMLAFDFKGLMATAITMFQALKTGIASARPAFVAIATVSKAAFSAVWEVVTVVFNGLMSSLGLTSGNFMTTFMEWAAIATWAFKEWPNIAELAFLNVGLGLVRLGAEFVHHFTVRIPTVLAWFGENFVDIFTTAASFVGSIFLNLGENIKNAMTAIWDFITSGGTELEFAWTPLTEGFKNTIKDMPDIPDRAVSALEKKMQADSERLAGALGGSLADEIDSNMQMLEEFQSKEVKLPTMDDVQLPDGVEEEGTAGDTKNKRTNFLVDSLNRGSEAALKAIFSNQPNSTAEKQLSTQKSMDKHLGTIAKNTRGGQVELTEAGAAT